MRNTQIKKLSATIPHHWDKVFYAHPKILYNAAERVFGLPPWEEAVFPWVETGSLKELTEYAVWSEKAQSRGGFLAPHGSYDIRHHLGTGAIEINTAGGVDIIIGPQAHYAEIRFNRPSVIAAGHVIGQYLFLGGEESYFYVNKNGTSWGIPLDEFLDTYTGPIDAHLSMLAWNMDYAMAHPELLRRSVIAGRFPKEAFDLCWMVERGYDSRLEFLSHIMDFELWDNVLVRVEGIEELIQGTIFYVAEQIGHIYKDDLEEFRSKAVAEIVSALAKDYYVPETSTLRVRGIEFTIIDIQIDIQEEDNNWKSIS